MFGCVPCVEQPASTKQAMSHGLQRSIMTAMLGRRHPLPPHRRSSIRTYDTHTVSETAHEAIPAAETKGTRTLLSSTLHGRSHMSTVSTMRIRVLLTLFSIADPSGRALSSPCKDKVTQLGPLLRGKQTVCFLRLPGSVAMMQLWRTPHTGRDKAAMGVTASDCVIIVVARPGASLCKRGVMA